MNKLDIAAQALLAPAELTTATLSQVLARVMTRRVDFADIYLQVADQESWYLEDGIVKDAEFSHDKGFGLRAMSGAKTGFAYADAINIKSIMQAAQCARSIAQQGLSACTSVTPRVPAHNLYQPINPLSSLSDAQKVELLRELDQYARARDARVTQVMISLSAEFDTVLLLNSVGLCAADVRPMVSLHVKVVVTDHGRREVGVAAGGGRCDYQAFLSARDPKHYVAKAVDQALMNLEAVAAPAGTMPVVLGPGWPGVLLHEAVGHGLEADFNRKGSSAFTGRLGQQVASPLCTVVDDGTLPARRGSLSMDDEGTPTQRTVLIEQGILQNYMQDTLNARLMKMQPTGNGRRESYACLPLPRMTNTYMLGGDSSPEDIIGSVSKGLYAVDFAGGQVDITSGKFVFTTSEAYLIENGKLTAPVKGATLIGNGPDVLTQVSMLGNDFALDDGIGTCGKEGQSVPVGVGQPTVKLDALTVGGTAK